VTIIYNIHFFVFIYFFNPIPLALKYEYKVAPKE